VATAMGIAEALKSKTIYSKPGEGATLVANGQVELGVGMMSEVAPVSGVQAISLRPDDPSSFIVFVGAMASAAKDTAASREFLTFMRSTAVKEVIRTQGMTAP
jgi:molybdate transport system substrate-binding protein